MLPCYSNKPFFALHRTPSYNPFEERERDPFSIVRAALLFLEIAPVQRKESEKSGNNEQHSMRSTHTHTNTEKDALFFFVDMLLYQNLSTKTTVPTWCFGTKGKIFANALFSATGIDTSYVVLIWERR